VAELDLDVFLFFCKQADDIDRQEEAESRRKR